MLKILPILLHIDIINNYDITSYLITRPEIYFNFLIFWRI